MPIALIKREDGQAAVLGSVAHEGSHIDMEMPVGPDDVIEGKRVADYPAGVHPLSQAMFAELYPDWPEPLKRRFQ